MINPRHQFRKTPPSEGVRGGGGRINQLRTPPPVRFPPLQRGGQGGWRPHNQSRPLPAQRTKRHNHSPPLAKGGSGGVGVGSTSSVRRRQSAFPTLQRGGQGGWRPHNQSRLLPAQRTKRHNHSPPLAKGGSGGVGSDPPAPYAAASPLPPPCKGPILFGTVIC